MSRQAGIALYANNLSEDDISEALRNHFPKRDIFINRRRNASADNLAQMESVSDSIVLRPFENLAVDSSAETQRLQQQLDKTNSELTESQEATAKAIHSVQTLHKQQQALYDEFVLLRERYDEQKTALVSILWIACAKYHPELREIPHGDCSSHEVNVVSD
jgi:DNA repair exonuclease SbcCD ATPase subunit